MPEPRTIWWRRLLLVIAVGPGAALILSLAMEVVWEPVAAFACLGALWGLTAGVLRRSLSRSLVGLHLGALLATAWHYIVQNYYDFHDWTLILSLGIAGTIFGAALNIRLRSLKYSIIAGGIAGLLSFSCLGLLYFAEVEFLTEAVRYLFNVWPIWLVAGAVSVVPFTTSLYLFFWLIADVLPRREAEREKAANQKG